MIEFHISYFDSIDSTNNHIKQAPPQKKTEGFVCRAYEQNSGYGRQGRLWTSPKGGLYQSLLVKPKRPLAELPLLSFVVALAIRSTLIEKGNLPGAAIALKWPNDLMARHCKIAGISMEATSEGILIGMGVNIFRPQDLSEDLLSDDKYHPIFFEEITSALQKSMALDFDSGSHASYCQNVINTIGDEILENFAHRYELWNEKGFDPFIEEYRSCAYLQGKRVRIQLLNGETIVEGVVVGVDERAQLLIDNGHEIQAVNSGEAHVL